MPKSARKSSVRLHGVIWMALGVLCLLRAVPVAAYVPPESLFVNSSTSTLSITSETNSHGAPDGAVASISERLANLHTWTFSFDNAVSSDAVIDSARIYITHRQSGWIDDSPRLLSNPERRAIEWRPTQYGMMSTLVV